MIRNFRTKSDCHFSGRLKWEFLKYKTHKFTLHYTKGLEKERQQKVTNLEKELNKLEISVDDTNNLGIDAVYNHIAEGMRIRSKCNLYEHDEKSKIF